MSTDAPSSLDSDAPWSLDSLARAVLAPSAPMLVDEASAIAFVVQHRWPSGTIPCPRCAAPCIRTGAKLRCSSCRRRGTVFIGTPLASLREPRVLAILLGIRGIAADKRGIAARPLARTVDGAPTTIWRHLGRLRMILPCPSASSTHAGSTTVLVCGRRGGAEQGAVRAAIADRRLVVHAADVDRRGRRQLALVGESFRTWINGTHHGVSARKLDAYAREFNARLTSTPDAIAATLLAALGIKPP